MHLPHLVGLLEETDRWLPSLSMRGRVLRELSWMDILSDELKAEGDVCPSPGVGEGGWGALATGNNRVKVMVDDSCACWGSHHDLCPDSGYNLILYQQANGCAGSRGRYNPYSNKHNIRKVQGRNKYEVNWLSGLFHEVLCETRDNYPLPAVP